MKIIKATGLVPVKALVSVDNFHAGQVFGMLPDDALKAVRAGYVELRPVRADIEIVEHATSEAPPAAEEPVASDKPVEIPEDWEARGPLVWIATAKKIVGTDIVLTDEQKQAGVKISDIAKATIAEELERRAAAEQAAQQNSDDPDDAGADGVGDEQVDSPE